MKCKFCNDDIQWVEGKVHDLDGGDHLCVRGLSWKERRKRQWDAWQKKKKMWMKDRKE